jgi:hypothetical protein
MTNSEDRTTDPKVDTPGDAQQVPVPNEHAVEGTSEQTPKTDGVYTYPEPSDQEE